VGLIQKKFWVIFYDFFWKELALGRGMIFFAIIQIWNCRSTDVLTLYAGTLVSDSSSREIIGHKSSARLAPFEQAVCMYDVVQEEFLMPSLRFVLCTNVTLFCLLG